MRSHQEFEARLFRKNKGLKQALEKRDIAFEIGLMLMEARAFKNLTQAALARLMKTKQPSIARAENGSYLPSLDFLLKVAKALGAELEIPRFRFSKTEIVKSEAVNVNAEKSHAVWHRVDISKQSYAPYMLSLESSIDSLSESKDVSESVEFAGMRVGQYA